MSFIVMSESQIVEIKLNCVYSSTETEGKKTAWEVGERKTEPRKKWRGNNHLCETCLRVLPVASNKMIDETSCTLIFKQVFFSSVLQGEGDAQQSKAEESKPVNDKSKNNTNSSVKQSVSAKDTDSSDSSEDESSDEDSDTKNDSGDSEVPSAPLIVILTLLILKS